MARDYQQMIIQLDARLSAFERSMRRAEQRTDRAARTIENRLDKMASTVSRKVQLSLGNLFAPLAGGLAVHSLVRYMDTWSRIENRLLATGTAASDLVAVQEQIYQVAQRSRAPLDAVATSYSRLQLSSQQLGLTQQEVLRVTETLSKALQIGGATAHESWAATIQLTQALGSGFLQGDELRSLRESAPVVAQAIAREFGVTVAELKELGSQGELTSDRVAKAILNATGQVEDAFGKMTPTIGQAATQLENSFIRMIAAFDDLAHVSDGIIWILGRVSDVVNGIAWAFETAAKGARQLGQDLGFTDLPAFERLESLRAEMENLERARQNILDFRAQSGSSLFAEEDLVGVERRMGEIRQEIDAIADGLREAHALKPISVTTAPPRVASAGNASADREAAARAAAIQDLEEEVKLYEELIAVFGRGAEAMDDIRATYEAANQARRLGFDIGSQEYVQFSALQEAARRLQKHLDLLEEGEEVTRSLWTVEQQRAATLANLQKLLDANAISQEVYNEAVYRASEEFERQEALIQELADFGERAFDRIGGAITDAFAKGELAALDFQSIVNAVLSEILQQMIKLAIINPLKNAIFGDALGGVLPTVFDLFGGGRSFSTPTSVNTGGFTSINAFPGMASGGPVRAGGAYQVGEHGRELFIPGVGGTIVPNSALSRSGGGNQIVNIITDPDLRVREQRSSTSQGEQLDVIIDRVVARNASTPGRQTFRALEQGGVRPRLPRR